MQNFLQLHSILNANQAGFLRNSCTEDVIHKLIDTVLKSLDKGRLVMTIFLNIKKAFDTIDHEKLIKKLEYMGFRGQFSKFLNPNC